MIKFHEQVPSVYSDASRDFQYLGWLINIVLNSVKHNVDDLYDLPNTKADPRLVELLALTLGFKIRRNYDQKQLAALVSIIPSILKYKGTKKAITMAGEALLTASGSIATFDCYVKENCLIVTLPKSLVDTTLFADLLPYILPAGMTCRIQRFDQQSSSVNPIEVAYDDVLYASWQKDLSWDTAKNTSAGLATMFDVDDPNKQPTFANYSNYIDHSDCELNTGLLDNSVIPLLESALSEAKADLKDGE